jgi:hypothetical protein
VELGFEGPRHVDRVNNGTLSRSRLGGCELEARHDAAHLILPAAAGCNHLLGGAGALDQVEPN